MLARTVRRRFTAFGLLLLVATALPATARADDFAVRLAAVLAGEVPLPATASVADPATVGRLYAAAGERPLWTGGDGPTPVGWAAVAAVNGALAEGLDPDRYHASTLQLLLLNPDPAARLAVEILLSDGLLRYVSDVARGRVAPKRENPELFTYPDAPDPVPVVLSAAAADAGRQLAALPPPHPRYAALKRELARLVDVAEAGGWPAVPEGDTFGPGDSGPRVAALRRRLARTDAALAAAPADAGDRFDAGLEAAVRRAQAGHGLATDGRVGRRTVAALNRSVESRIRQVMVNMERWRWLPRDLGDAHVLVNAAGYRLFATEAGERVLEMRVVVGRAYRRTPIFSSRISQVIANPDWTVPVRIAVEDLLPKLRRDPAYLDREGFEVLRQGRPVPPADIDWSRLGPGRFPYVLRQRPGERNALGRYKFQLPNRYAIYLHDSPARELFRRDVRAFSSGCVRVQEPCELAAWLALVAGGDAGRIDEAVAAGLTRMFALKAPVPVHFTYFTAWADESGRVQLLEDVYGRDQELIAILRDQLVTGLPRAGVE